MEHGAGEEYEAQEHMMGARLEEEEKEGIPYGEEGEEEQIEAYDPEEAKQEEEADPIHEQIARIIELCKERNALFGDPDFPANDASLYKNPAEPPEYAVQTPVVEWRRPQEIADEPEMIRGGFEPGDVKQGTLGDCWLLGTLMTLGTKPELLQNLIVYDGIEHGFAVFQFFKNGEWIHVIVDTRLPYNSQSKTPLYGHCADVNEFWVPLMEKAYAKLHGCYEIMDGGSMSEGLVDLTGGISQKYNLTAPETIELRDSGQLWKDLKKFHQLGYLIGCARAKVDEDGKQEEGQGTQGILYNHAYGVLDI